MSRGKITKSFHMIYANKIVVTVIFIAVFMIYYCKNTGVAIASGGYDLDLPIEDEGSMFEGNKIAFDNDRVELGVPLRVTGAPDASIYRWTFTAADGTSYTYTSKDNTYIPVEADMETLITVTVEGVEGAVASIYCSSLPVIYINNDKGYYGVGDEYSKASMSIQGNKKYINAEELYDGDIRIRLRGNSTRWRDKKPFNIKLEKKTDLLRMGKNKHWALLANDIDHTLMRNKLLYDLSGSIGMDTYSKSENVILIFNNEYYGVYQLCELVNVGAERVQVYDWEESAETAADAIVERLLQDAEIVQVMEKSVKEELEEALCEDLSWITSPYTFSYDVNQDGTAEIYTITDYTELPAATGGVLLEMDFYAFDGHNPSTMITAYSQPIYFKTPEHAITNPELFRYTQRYVQAFEHALHSTDFVYHEDKMKFRSLNQAGGHEELGYISSNFSAPEYDGKHYSELFNLDSLVDYFLVSELSMNWDSMKNSVFMYKDIDGLFHMGPAWDYDWCWGNINMYNINTWYPTSWHTTEEDFTIEQYYQKVQWNRSLIRDPYFLVKVYEKYQEIRGTIVEELVKSGGTIDTYAKELSEAAVANDARWSYTYSQYHSVGFEESLANMKKFLEFRIQWMDEQFASLEQLISSFGYYTPSSDLEVTKVDMTSDKDYVLITTEVRDSEISFVAFQVNGSHLYNVAVVDGKAEASVPIRDMADNQEKLNVVQLLAKNSEDEYLIDTMDKGNYYNAKSNYYVFLTDKKVAENITDSMTKVDADKAINSEDKNTSLEVNASTLDEDKVAKSEDNIKKVRNIFLVVMIVCAGLMMQGLGIYIVFNHRNKRKKTGSSTVDDTTNDIHS